MFTEIVDKNGDPVPRERLLSMFKEIEDKYRNPVGKIHCDKDDCVLCKTFDCEPCVFGRYDRCDSLTSYQNAQHYNNKLPFARVREEDLPIVKESFDARAEFYRMWAEEVKSLPESDYCLEEVAELAIEIDDDMYFEEKDEEEEGGESE